MTIAMHINVRDKDSRARRSDLLVVRQALQQRLDVDLAFAVRAAETSRRGARAQSVRRTRSRPFRCNSRVVLIRVRSCL